MGFNALNYDGGSDQGRCTPDHFSQNGDYALVLGHDEPLTFQRFRVGDYMVVHQTQDIGSTKLFKVRCRVRGPEEMPNTIRWRFSIFVDGVEKAYRICNTNQTVDYVNMAVNMAGLAGVHAIAFVLKLEEI